MCFNSPNAESQTLGPERALGATILICSFRTQGNIQSSSLLSDVTLNQWQSLLTYEGNNLPVLVRIKLHNLCNVLSTVTSTLPSSVNSSFYLF